MLKVTGCLLGETGNGMQGVKEGTGAEGVRYMKEMWLMFIPQEEKKQTKTKIDIRPTLVGSNGPFLSYRHTLKQLLQCSHTCFTYTKFTVTELTTASYESRKKIYFTYQSLK